MVAVMSTFAIPTRHRGFTEVASGVSSDSVNWVWCILVVSCVVMRSLLDLSHIFRQRLSTTVLGGCVTKFWIFWNLGKDEDILEYGDAHIFLVDLEKHLLEIDLKRDSSS